MDNKREILQQLIVDLVSDGKIVDVPVYGISMFPFLLPGNSVRVEAVAFDSIKKGDVVLFDSYGKLILHRVVRKGMNSLQCKGDSMIHYDSVIERSPVAKVIAWKKNEHYKSVSTFYFRVYAILMVALQCITGYVLRPMSIVWLKFSNRLW